MPNPFLAIEHIYLLMDAPDRLHAASIIYLCFFSPSMVWSSRCLGSWKQSADLAYICLHMKKRYNMQVNAYSRVVSVFFCGTWPWNLICKCSLWVIGTQIRKGRCEAISWMSETSQLNPTKYQVCHTHFTPLLSTGSPLFCLYKFVNSTILFLTMLTMVHVIYYWYKYLSFISQNGVSYVFIGLLRREGRRITNVLQTFSCCNEVSYFTTL